MDGNDVVVTNIIGSGPEAKHFRFSYRPDYEADKERIGELFDESGGEITYLGDWHTHPSSSSHLSWMDKRALRNMARFEGNFMDAPIMLIASNGSGQWDNLCWRVYRDTFCLGFLGWDYLKLDVILY